ncbi:unnamed protein product, partial [marine sediment metagenome]
FTVLDNMDSLWAGTIKEALKMVKERAWSKAEAIKWLTPAMTLTVPTEFEPEIEDRLSEEQRQVVLDTYARINVLRGEYLERIVSNAAVEAAVERERKKIGVAKKYFVNWTWTEAEAKDYLYKAEIEPVHATALIEDWTPDRDAEEKLPSVSMLEELLRLQKMSVKQFRQVLRDKRYPDRTIDMILATQERLPTRSMLEDFWEDDRLSDNEYILRMTQLGYSPDTAHESLAMLKIPPEKSRLDELWRNRSVTDDEYVTRLIVLGYSRERARADLLKLKGR